MKRTLHILVLLILCSVSVVQAQNRPMNKQQFRERQKNFLIEKAKLTPEEAKAFFPLYFELQEKKHNLNQEAWGKLRREQKEKLTDSEYSKMIDDVAKARIAADQLEYEYLQEYKKILSAKKIYRIQRAEMHFHRDLLKCYRHSNRPQGARGPRGAHGPQGTRCPQGAQNGQCR